MLPPHQRIGRNGRDEAEDGKAAFAFKACSIVSFVTGYAFITGSGRVLHEGDNCSLFQPFAVFTGGQPLA
jgi:hypothetical protein